MDNVLDIYRVQYYTPFLVDLLALLCFITGLVKRKVHPDLKLFAVYGFLYFAMDALFLTFYYSGMQLSLNIRIIQNWDNMITLFELIVYYVFFRPLLTRKQGVALSVSSVCFVLIFILVTAGGNLHGEFSQTNKNILYTIQSLILIMGCIFYYYNLYNSKVIADLKNLPSFWIAMGVLWLSLGALPFSLCERYVADHHPWASYLLFTLYNVFNCINFFFILKAYLCLPMISMSSSTSSLSR